jgi:hypothetical protein
MATSSAWRERRMKTTLAHLAATLALLAPVVASAQGAGTSCHVRTPTLQGSYAGDCAGGIANGRGRAQGADRYEGDWRDGVPHGEGTYSYADGRRFEGRFEVGRVNGRARFVYPSGDVLEGEFRNDELFGVGRMARTSGEVLMVQLQGGSLVVVAQGSAVPAPLPSAPAVPSTAPPPAVPSAPAAPAAAPAASVETALCDRRLRLEVLSLTRTGPGQVQMVAAYENLANTDVRLEVHHDGHRSRTTYLVDDSGEVWQLLSPRQGGAKHVQEMVFVPGNKSRATFTFSRASGGQEARRFVLVNAVQIRAAHGTSPPGVAGSCQFDVRGITLTSGG